MKDVFTGFGLAINFLGVVLLGVNSYLEHNNVKALNDRDETRPSYPYVDSAIQRLEKRIDDLDPAVRDTIKVVPKPRRIGDLEQ